MKHSANNDSKHLQIRSAIRQRRRNLSPEAQKHAAQRLFAHVTSDLDYQEAKSVAFYIAFDGEIDPSPILQHALDTGKACYLPVLSTNSTSLLFAQYKVDEELEKNIFGIEEPLELNGKVLAPEEFDLIFIPLVAFDAEGSRLGMGKGFYDRTLATLRGENAQLLLKRPRLIGLAHECQRVERLERADWDIPMEKVITDQATYSIGS